MPWIIDGHQDLAYNALTFKRDIRRSAAETRAAEVDTFPPTVNGQATVGWADFQRGQVAIVFGSIFQSHRQHLSAQWEVVSYTSFAEADRVHHRQFDFYRWLVDVAPQQYQWVRTRRELNTLLDARTQVPAANHPVGLLLTMEGAEGIANPLELETWWQRGLRLIGLVWAGGRFCGSNQERGGFTSEGLHMLEVMAGTGYALDLAHMNEMSALQAVDAYPGTVVATHANARALHKTPHGERHLTDQTIRRLAERGGVMGIVPFNRFLLPEWQNHDDRALVTLDHVVAQIDHICQLTGSVAHAAFGTDFDGGFGYPAIPLEMDTIADLQKLEPRLAERGYSPADIRAIFGGNWQRILNQILPD